MKYYLQWLNAIVKLTTPFMCFAAAFLHSKTDPKFSTMFWLMGLISLNSIDNVKIPSQRIPSGEIWIWPRKQRRFFWRNLINRKNLKWNDLDKKA